MKGLGASSNSEKAWREPRQGEGPQVRAGALLGNRRPRASSGLSCERHRKPLVGFVIAVS